jgi:hypothetical protein
MQAGAREKWPAEISVLVSICGSGVRRTGRKDPRAGKSGRMPAHGRPPDVRSARTGPPVSTEGNKAMRFFGYTMGDPSAPMPPPTPGLMAEMGAFIEEATKAGVLLAAGGLAPLDEATRVTYSGGKFTVVDGPFTEAKELIGGWALMEARDKDEAVEWTKRFLAIAGDGESTIRQVY